MVRPVWSWFPLWAQWITAGERLKGGSEVLEGIYLFHLMLVLFSSYHFLDPSSILKIPISVLISLLVIYYFLLLLVALLECIIDLRESTLNQRLYHFPGNARSSQLFDPFQHFVLLLSCLLILHLFKPSQVLWSLKIYLFNLPTFLLCLWHPFHPALPCLISSF